MHIKFGFWGTLGGCMGCSLVTSGSFCVLRHKADSWSCAQTLPYLYCTAYKNASRLLVSESEKSNQFML